MSLEIQQQDFIKVFESWLESYLSEASRNSNISEVLLKSQSYSLQSGGKRFRPFLAFLVYGLFSENFNKLKNFCLSLEMIHTYSLIHDDLPCMDNDDFRRGKPTNHKAFSEDIALLAGDGLLSDIFYLLSTDTHFNAETIVQLVRLISEKIGSQGMVSGQALDMKANKNITFEELKKIHTLKTANLIQTAAIGAAMIADCNKEQINEISDFSYHLGMAFQIKDDLLDAQDKEQDFKSYLSLIGKDKTQDELNKHSKHALQHLKNLNKNTDTALTQLIDFNLLRNS